MMDYRNTTLCYPQCCATSELISEDVCRRFYHSAMKISFIQQGIASIYYDISQFSEFTIIVENQSEFDMIAYLGLSPNGVLFEPDQIVGEKIIKPGELGIFPGAILIHYTAIYINATICSNAIVYFQGQLLE